VFLERFSYKSAKLTQQYHIKELWVKGCLSLVDQSSQSCQVDQSCQGLTEENHKYRHSWFVLPSPWNTGFHQLQVNFYYHSFLCCPASWYASSVGKRVSAVSFHLEAWHYLHLRGCFFKWALIQEGHISREGITSVKIFQTDKPTQVQYVCLHNKENYSDLHYDWFLLMINQLLEGRCIHVDHTR